MSNTSSTGRTHAGRDLLRTAALAVGAVFLLVGVLGFVPGITTNYGELGAAGHHSGALLLGVFQVSVLHNLVHLGLGLVGVVLARTASGARLFLLGGGFAYLVIWLYGLFIEKESGLNFVPLNEADDWLHLALGLGMLALGLMLTDPMSSTRSRSSH